MKAIGPVLAVLACLTLVPGADAQIWRWFGPKTPEKNASKSAQPDPRRLAEANVEVAWLADPITFPYYLEAHATGTQMEVRGYVPNKTVREQALRIAQVYSSQPVLDAMKEHPSLLVKPGQLSAQQLQGTAQSSLRVALPKQYQQLKVECGSDGKVSVVGTLTSIEEKVTVSHALRRLHGCTSVQNMTTIPTTEVIQNVSTVEPREKTPIVKTSNPTESKSDRVSVGPEVKSRSWFIWPFGRNSTKEEPPLADARKPIDRKPDEPSIAEPQLMPEVVKAGVAPMARVPALSTGELKKRIQAACPDVKNIDVQFTSATEVRVSLEIRTDRDLEPTAQRLFALPELRNYQVAPVFRISAR